MRTDRSRRVGTVPVHDAAQVVDWAQRMTEVGRIERYQLTPASLEDVYVDLVGHADASRPAQGEETAA